MLVTCYRCTFVYVFRLFNTKCYSFKAGSGGSAANILKEVRMRVLTTGQCSNRMPPNLSDDITDLHICVDDGGADRAGVCQVKSTQF